MGATSWEEGRQLSTQPPFFPSSAVLLRVLKGNLLWNPRGQETKCSSYSQSKSHHKIIHHRSGAGSLSLLRIAVTAQSNTRDTVRPEAGEASASRERLLDREDLTSSTGPQA